MRQFWDYRSTGIAILIVFGWGVGLSTSRAADQENRQRTEVGELIEQLGSDSYATRVRAKEKLQRMGLEAFDELHSAQFRTDDNEIAMAASHLVSSLLVKWSKETDPPEVREALDEYGAQSESERLSRIEMLAELSDRKALDALVRLARFETSLRLSRRAALALMQQPMAADPDTRRRHSEQVLEVLGANDRQASQWLRVYAEDLSSGGYSAQRWRELIDRQRQEIDTAATQQSTRPSVLELVRVCATRAARSDQRAEALRLASANLDLIPPTTRDLVDACGWAIDNNLHSFVLELRRHHQRMFDDQPILLYGAAEATKVGGDVAQADQLADRALKINALPQDDQQRARMSPKEIEETAKHIARSARSWKSVGCFIGPNVSFAKSSIRWRLIRNRRPRRESICRECWASFSDTVMPSKCSGR